MSQTAKQFLWMLAHTLSLGVYVVVDSYVVRIVAGFVWGITVGIEAMRLFPVSNRGARDA